AIMGRLFLAVIVIGAVAVHQAIPPPKDIGTGDEQLFISIHTNQPYVNRSVEEEMEIKNYSSLLGKVDKLKAVNLFDFTDYQFFLLNAKCSKVKSYIKDVVRNTKHVDSAIVTCAPKNRKTNYTEDTFFITKDNITTIQRKYDGV
uniref:Secreted protein n=1 Tax=Haemonchus contortus TaxID=6289 RepID=A0A7I4YKF6_HAECO